MAEPVMPAVVDSGLLYAQRSYAENGEWYARHAQAMTKERLGTKAAIAWELAYRDTEIDRLRAALTASESQRDRYAAALCSVMAIDAADLEAFMRKHDRQQSGEQFATGSAK